MTTADYLEQLQQDKDDLVDNLTTKGITGLTGDETFTELVPEVLNIQTGGKTTPEEKDVCFYDYDGTLLYSYTKQEFLALTSMPENPTHEGLTAQGWNWTLEEAKTYLNNGYTLLDIGQTYITDDEKTRIYVELDNVSLKPYLYLTFSDDSITVDWGDGTTETINQSYTQHTYSQVGSYIITIQNQKSISIGMSGNSDFLLSPNTSKYDGGDKNNYYMKKIKKIECGKNVNLGYRAFEHCNNVKIITLSNSTSINASYIFEYCYNLKALIIPRNNRTITSNFITTADGLEKLIFPNLTNLSNFGGVIGCVKRLIIPNYELSNYGAYTPKLQKKEICKTTSAFWTNWFQNLKLLEEVILPTSITGINTNGFLGCESLTKINCENITGIYIAAFQDCRSLTYLKFGDVTTIRDNAFRNCYNMKVYDFTNNTAIPTLTSGAFYGINDDCKIIVPDDLYEDWIVAENWSTYVSNIISKSNFDALNS